MSPQLSAYNPRSSRIPQLKLSEGQTWSSEDTGVFSFKVFLTPAVASICLMSLRSALTAAAFSEAQRIVFAAEGLLLAHDFCSTAESGFISNPGGRQVF
jgi:hypothetical protein